MKRTAPFFLLTLLLMVPLVANAQTGWVKMPDGPWTNIDRIDFFNDTSGYVGAGGLIWLTSDGGLSWAVDSSTAYHWQARCDNQYTWTEIKRAEVNVHFFRRDIVVFAGTAYHKFCDNFNADANTGKIWVRKPNSSRWSDYDMFLNRPVHQLLVFGDTIYASAREGGTNFDLHHPIYGFQKSPDAGKTWRRIVPSVESAYRSIKIVFETGLRGLVWLKAFDPSTSEDTSRLVRTTDGGMTWSPATKPQEDEKWNDTLLHIGEGIYLFKSYGSRKYSFDFGASWRDDTLPQPEAPEHFRDEYYKESAGYRLKQISYLFAIEFSMDSGNSWIEQIGVSDTLIDLSAPSERVAYAVGPNGVLYKTTDGGGRFADVKQGEAKSGAIRAWSSGDDIIIEGSAGKEVRIFDLLGRLVRSGAGERFEGMQPGAHVVTCGGESVRVLISP